MKVLGTKQFQQKKYKILPLEGEWLSTFGDIPSAFMCIIYGSSGHGKTEFSVRFAKHLTSFGTVGWLSYEQGHGSDLQRAVNRNKMEEVSGKIIFGDPNDKPRHVTFLEDLDALLSKRNSPDFIFIDSLKYTRFTFDDYVYLKNKFGKKKAFIWIEHAKGKAPARQVGIDIEYDGHIGIFVHNYIAYVHKNRYSAFNPFVIYEKMAREKNPFFFKVKHQEEPEPKATNEKKPSKAARKHEEAVET